MEVLYDDFKRSFPNRAIRRIELNEISKKVITDILGGKGFHIPDVYEICAMYPNIEKRYVAIYDKAVENVPEKARKKVEKNTKIAQGMLLDGLVSAYKIVQEKKNELNQSSMVSNLAKFDKDKKDTMQLISYLLPNGIQPSGSLAQKNYNDMAKVVQKNGKDGGLVGFRFESHYVSGTEIMSVMANRPKDKLTIESELKQVQSLTAHQVGIKRGNFVLIPYLVVAKIMEDIRQLAMSNVLRITIRGYGVERTRDVTGNPVILCNRELNPDVFNIETSIDVLPILGKMYIPIVGVPSLTIAKEKINIHNIQNIEIIPAEAYEPSEIAKESTPQSEMKDIEVDSAIYMLTRFCKEYCKASSPQEADPQLKAVMDELGIRYEDVTAEYIAYLQSAVPNIHGCKTFRERARITDNIKGLRKLVQIKESLYDPETYTSKSIRDMREYDGDPETRKQEILNMLNQGVCRVQYITNDVSMQSITCTKNKKAMTQAYGADWYWEFASKRQKLSRIYEEVGKGKSVKDAFEMVHMKGYDDAIEQAVKDAIAQNPVCDENALQNLAVAMKTNLTAKRDLSDNMIYVTELYNGIPNHIYHPDGAVKSLGIDKIMKVIMLKRFD